MGLISHFKAEPTEYARKNANGVIKAEGKGISFFYMPYNTSIELVSLGLQNSPFAFTELSFDNQEVVLQGEFIYRISDPALVMAKYCCAVEPNAKRYLKQDIFNLPQHLLQMVQGDARKVVQATSLEKLIVMCDELSKHVLDAVRKEESITGLGVSYEMLYFTSIKPKPEIAKALEASYREALLQRADEAIYRRRATAVEKERVIRANEMNTEIGLEEQRKTLVALKNENTIKEAEAKAAALKAELNAFDGKDAATITAHGIYLFGAHADKLRDLTITPELLGALMKK